jgi:hypothetical protein
VGSRVVGVFRPSPLESDDHSLDFHQYGVALAATGAYRREPSTASHAPQAIEERHQDAGAGSPDRVPQSQRPAARVYDLGVHPEDARRVDRNPRERLVYLHEF